MWFSTRSSTVRKIMGHIINEIVDLLKDTLFVVAVSSLLSTTTPFTSGKVPSAITQVTPSNALTTL